MSVQKPAPPPVHEDTAPILTAAGQPEAKRHRVWPWVAVAVLVLLGFLLVRGKNPSSEGKAAAGKGGKPAAPRPIPVVATGVKTGDLGVYLTGLGTVTAINTVTVRSRVDGQLVNVAYKEGQLVAPG